MKSELLIVKDHQGAYWVSGRSLSDLTSNYGSSQFSKWIVSRIKSFIEGEDYKVVATKSINPAAPRGSTDTLLTLKVAQFIARKDHKQAVLDLLQQKQAELTNTGTIAGVNLIGYVPTAPEPSGSASVIAGNSIDIGITQTGELGMAIRARSLFNKIALPSVKKGSTRDMFYDWLSSRIKKFELIDGTDYLVLPNSVILEGSNRRVMDAWLTVKTAKQFAKWQQAGRGKEAYEQIVKEEESLKKTHPSPTPVMGQSELDLPFSTSALTANDERIDNKAPDQVTASTPDSNAKVVEAFKAVEQVAKSVVPSPQAEVVGNPSTMPTLVSKTRSQQLIEKQQQLQEELERTLREEEEEQKKLVEATPAPDQLADVVERLHLADQRINAMERWISTFTGLIQQGAKFLAGELPVGTPNLREVTAPAATQTEDPFHAIDFSQESAYGEYVPNNSPRAQIDGLVKNYAQAKQHPYGDIWRHLYRQLNEVYHFNVSRGKHSKESYVDYVERSGQIDNLLSIAQSTLRTVASGAQA